MLLRTRIRAWELFSSRRCMPLRLMIPCLLLLVVIFLFNDPGCPAALSHGALPTVSFEVKDTPLRALIDEHLNSTGYTVKGCEKWDDVRVTLKAQGVPLDEVLRSILKRVGITSYVMKINEGKKQITLRRLDKSLGTATLSRDSNEGGLLPLEGNTDFVPPPEIKDMPPALSRDEILDSEITPPSEPGGKGMTLRELLARSPEPQDPMDREITPPSESGGRGLTLRELIETRQ